ncbi:MULTISPECIES: YceI family protein [unclassified Paenibacillus]|uniref:YceI family protein n=1 Tax=unclassified Paenibacillus TaxID=185978 RepID=UPI0008CEFFD6|nr:MULTISPECIES: YceI family protein [unclassified Paenibacillus]QLG37675.1 polyisoprenoid-binding protein [Paenibacillus sp. E222]SEO45632.1 Polyisoprenoid-binding protein YceI [Paenibacillus sp. OK076]
MNSIQWEVDPDHSSVEFSVAHLMINKIKGVFEQFEAVLSFDPNDVTTLGIRASIDANSVTTRQRQRDEHLRSEEFFDAANYPAITFQSTNCVLTGERQYELAGNLTLHGVTKPITFHTVFEGFNKDPRGRERAGFHSNASIDRNEFGLSFNSPLETGGIVVGNEVNIELYIEAIRID